MAKLRAQDRPSDRANLPTCQPGRIHKLSAPVADRAGGACVVECGSLLPLWLGARWAKGADLLSAARPSLNPKRRRTGALQELRPAGS
jgi:hypothetical protein